MMMLLTPISHDHTPHSSLYSLLTPQVFINYGEKGNADLLLLYGFALDRNPFDSVDISVGIKTHSKYA
jgi:hypothetical protein